MISLLKCLVIPLCCSAILLFNCKVVGQTAQFSLPALATENDYIPNTIIFKIAPQYSKSWSLENKSQTKLDQILDELQSATPQRIFPAHKSPINNKNLWGQPLTDLSLIYECTFSKDISLESAINNLLSSGIIEYAQPRYIQKLFAYVPDDPLNTNQYHLDLIKMFDAWDIEKGDTNMVVGITDWGVEITHPDLVNNIKYNKEDPIDGIDNDNDGYIDNFMGWDMGSNDNNPQGTIAHGTYVSGYAAASTDNGMGVSGTGFRCKFLPIKIADNNNNGSMGYEGMVYAADHGCKVINCSWGNYFYEGPYGQDIVNYIAINRDAVILAACGNSDNTNFVYPASYENVISVAATNGSDIKADFSTYGNKVDLCAPGQDVWSTSAGGTYDYSSGTSFASPIATGAAAILRSHFPTYNSIQISHQLKVTCDLIDTLPGNIIYSGLLGAGRINMFRALTQTDIPSVEMINLVFEDADNDQVFEKDDTLSLSGEFFNFLAPSSPQLTARISTSSIYVKLIDSVFAPGNISTMSSVNNLSNPFVFFIKPDVPASEVITFKISFSDTAYSAFQYFELIISPDYITIDTNRIAVTVTSDGILGYNKGISTQGIGFTYNHGRSLMSSGGFLAGISPAQVSDAVIGFSGVLDQDFLSEGNIAKISNPQYADFETISIYNDSLAGVSKMQLRVVQRTLAWNDTDKDKFVILEFTLHNYGITQLSDLYAGYFIDWDIKNNMLNRASFDATRRMGYVFPFDVGIYAGIKLLSTGGIFHYAFDNNGINGSIDLSDGFSGLEKYFTLKSNRPDAGSFAPGNDVSDMVSTGPFNLLPGDSVKIAFALVIGDYLSDIQNFAEIAQLTYDQLSAIHETNSESGICILADPNPFLDQFIINVFLPKEDDIQISVYNIIGKCVFATDNNTFSAGNHSSIIPCESMLPGLYSCRIKTKNNTFVKKMLKL